MFCNLANQKSSQLEFSLNVSFSFAFVIYSIDLSRCFLQAVNPAWQKPLKLLMSLISRYGFFKNGWILDAMCGSGSSSHAAILSGMNAFLFDEIDWKVKASKFRAEDFRNQYDSETEILGRQEKETQDDAAGPDEDAAATEKDEDDAFLNAGTEDPDEGTPPFPSIVNTF